MAETGEERWTVVVSDVRRSDMARAGVPIRVAWRGPNEAEPVGGALVPVWSMVLWNCAPIGWRTVLLLVARLEPETRAALLTIVELSDDRVEALFTWCWSRWPSGSGAAWAELSGRDSNTRGVERPQE